MEQHEKMTYFLEKNEAVTARASSCLSFLNSPFFLLIPSSSLLSLLLILSSFETILEDNRGLLILRSNCFFLILTLFHHLSDLMLQTFSVLKCFSLDFCRTSLIGCFQPLSLFFSPQLLNIFCFVLSLLCSDSTLSFVHLWGVICPCECNCHPLVSHLQSMLHSVVILF